MFSTSPGHPELVSGSLNTESSRSPCATRSQVQWHKTSSWLLVGILSLVLSSCNTKQDIDDLMQKQGVFPTEQGEIVEILYTDSGLVRVRITAPVMNHFTFNVPEPYTEMPKGVYIEFYNDSSKVKTTLKADYGIRYEKSKRTEVKNKVEVVNINGEVLNTDKLNWDEATRKIYTDAFVKIKTKNDVLRGTGMEANEDFTEWEMKNIIGSKEMPEEKKE